MKTGIEASSMTEEQDSCTALICALRRKKLKITPKIQAYSKALTVSVILPNKSAFQYHNASTAYKILNTFIKDSEYQC